MGVFLVVLLVPFAYLLSTGALEWGPVKQVDHAHGHHDPARRRVRRAATASAPAADVDEHEAA